VSLEYGPKIPILCSTRRTASGIHGDPGAALIARTNSFDRMTRVMQDCKPTDMLEYTPEVARETAPLLDRVKAFIPPVEWPTIAPLI
ncbi:uncharacterized protein METZ01_LOCUS195573, partial [marine metagenome]